MKLSPPPSAVAEFTSVWKTWFATLYDKVLSGGIIEYAPLPAVSGTSIAFTSIPAGTKRITLSWSDLQITSGSANLRVQLGDSGGIETSGYRTMSTTIFAATVHTTGFVLQPINPSTDVAMGQITLTLVDEANNTWCGEAITGSSTTVVSPVIGHKSLSDTLTTVVLNTTAGTATFSSGSVYLTYE